MAEAVPNRKFAALVRILKGLPLALISPLLMLAAVLSLLACDIAAKLRGRRALPVSILPDTQAASIVIPNWNGRDLLEKYLPSVMASIEHHPGSEVVVVDNGSADGSAVFVRERFPQVNLIALDHNRGFGGGSNTGFLAAKNDIVVLLNSDMRVERDFLRPLLDGFTDENVFSVSCQIFFSDPAKVRQETGLTESWWQQGGLRVRHRADDAITELYPCAYGGGGSCAFDRRKFSNSGASTNSWRPSILKTPISVIWPGRGDGKRCTSPRASFITSTAEPSGADSAMSTSRGFSRRISCFSLGRTSMNGPVSWATSFTWSAAVLSWLFGDSPERANFSGIARAVWQLPRAVASRSRALRLAAITDTEAFRRPMGGHFRDTFSPMDESGMRVLFVSPYPICLRSTAEVCSCIRPSVSWHSYASSIWSSCWITPMSSHPTVSSRTFARPLSTWCAQVAIRRHSDRSSLTPFGNFGLRILPGSSTVRSTRKRSMLCSLIHRAWPVRRPIPPNSEHLVRTRRIFSIHRAPPSLHQERD